MRFIQKFSKSIEDIDFVMDCYEGDGTYQVIDGEYRKIRKLQYD